MAGLLLEVKSKILGGIEEMNICGQSYEVSKNCIHYKPEDTFDCTVEGNKCIMTGNKVPKKADGHIESLEEYKDMLKNLITVQFKSLDYAMGYIVCLKDHNLLGLEDSLELLKHTSKIYFKREGHK